MVLRSKCNAFFDFLFGLFLAIFPIVLVLLWLLHQKGLFDPFYDWWEDHCMEIGEDKFQNPHRHNRTDFDHIPVKHHTHKTKRDKILDTHQRHRHHHHHQHRYHDNEHDEKGSDYHLHHVQKAKQKHHGHKRHHAHQREERRKHGKGKEAMNMRRSFVEVMDEISPVVNHRQSPQPNLKTRE